MRHIVPDSEGLARIPIDQLVLDSGNPRIPGMEEAEAETIGLMLRDQKRAGKNKLIALATSIAEHGYSANEPLLVKPLGGDRFLVVEGNRRVTAMKLAISPSLLPAEFSDLTKRFETLGEAMADIEPFCLVSEDDKYLRRMMWLRHSGTGDGEGLDPWNSAQKARYKETHDNKPDPYLRLRDTLVEHFPRGSQARADAASIPNTTFKRFFQAPEVKHELGIKREDNGLCSYDGGHDDRLRYVLRELAVKGERRIDSKAQVLDLLEESKGSPIVEDEPSEQTELELGGEGATASNHGDADSKGTVDGIRPTGSPEEGVSHETAPSDGEGKHGRTPSYELGRKRVIPRTHNLNTRDDPRIKQVHRELRDIDPEAFPTAAALLLRTLIQICADSHLEANGLRPAEFRSFASKIDKSTQILQEKKLMQRSDLASIRQIAHNDSSSAAVTLHMLDGAAHASSWIAPSASDLIRTWDGIYKVLEKMMEDRPT